MRRITKRPAYASQGHTIEFLIISFGVHMLLAFLLSSSLFRDVSGKFGVESLAVSPLHLSESGDGELLVVDYIPAPSAKQWREAYDDYLNKPLADADFSGAGNPAKTSAEIDPSGKFVPCREFRCVASNSRGSQGRMHWIHISNVSRIERTQKDGPIAYIVPIVVTETSEPMNIYVSSDADVTPILVGAPGVRIERAILENRNHVGMTVVGRVNSQPDRSGKLTRYFLTKNIKSSSPIDHLWIAPEDVPPSFREQMFKSDKYTGQLRLREPDELTGVPPAPSGGPDQIVDISQIVGKSSCKERNVYVGGEQNYEYDVTSSLSGGGGSVQLVADYPDEKNYELASDPCDPRLHSKDGTRQSAKN
jgi:hypothetical protein